MAGPAFGNGVIRWTDEQCARRLPPCRRMASHVDKIRNGAKPAELPVEFPTKVELVVNANAAQRIGLSIPPAVRAREDEVIR